MKGKLIIPHKRVKKQESQEREYERGPAPLLMQTHASSCWRQRSRSKPRYVFSTRECGLPFGPGRARPGGLRLGTLRVSRRWVGTGEVVLIGWFGFDMPMRRRWVDCMDHVSAKNLGCLSISAMGDFRWRVWRGGLEKDLGSLGTGPGRWKMCVLPPPKQLHVTLKRFSMA